MCGVCFLSLNCGNALEDREVDSGPVADTDTDSDSDTGTDSDGHVGCPAPMVFCDEDAPKCPENTYPAADRPCTLGNCPDRCWTGECVPCEAECVKDTDCVLVRPIDCCASDMFNADCSYATTLEAAAANKCALVKWEQPPNPLPDCAVECDYQQEIPEELKCGGGCHHCGYRYARCEGGRCVGANPDCEPKCGCD